MNRTEPTPKVDNTAYHKRVTIPLVLAGILAVIAILSRVILTFGTNQAFSSAVSDYTSRFSAGFERIVLESIPFLLLGALAAAVVEHLFSSEEISAIYSKRLANGLAAGLLTGFILPVGEGGSILLARALIKKGAGIPSAAALMLAAPALNILSFAVTLGSGEPGQVFWIRTGIGVSFAVLFGVLLSLEREPNRLVNPELLEPPEGMDEIPGVIPRKLSSAQLKAIGVTTARGFLEFLTYMIVVALASAIIQILLPVSWIPPVEGGLMAQIGSAGLWSMVMAPGNLGDLLALRNSAVSWSISSQIVFLSLGILVDVKLLVLYTRVFRKKIVLYLAALAFAAAVLAGLIAGIVE